jgi:hypothetical protein
LQSQHNIIITVNCKCKSRNLPNNVTITKNESTNYPTPTLILPFGNGIDSNDTGQAPAIILQMQFAGDIEIQEEEEPQFVAAIPEDIPIAIVSFLRLLSFNAILLV